MEVRPVATWDRDWVASQVEAQWGTREVVSRGRISRPEELPGFLVLEGEERIGLATYRIEGDECEIVTLHSLVEGKGAGSALVAAVADIAARAGCRRLWLVTTNDNLRALGFYQKRGFRITTVHKDAIVEARRLKPAIPLQGFYGIPLRDEIELEMHP